MNLVETLASVVLALGVVLGAFVAIVRYGSRIENLEKSDQLAKDERLSYHSDVRGFWEKQSIINESLARIASRLDQYIESSEKRLDRLEDLVLRILGSEKKG